MVGSGISASKERQRDAEQFLHRQDARFLAKSIQGLTEALGSLAQNVPTNNEKKIELIARAYALTLMFRHKPAFLRAVARHVGRKTSDNPTRMFIEALYPSGDKKTQSSWTIAVEYLHATNVLPSAVTSLSKTKGEGINSWSRGGKLAHTGSAEKPFATPVVVRITKAGKAREWSVDRENTLSEIEKALSKATRISRNWDKF